VKRTRPLGKLEASLAFELLQFLFQFSDQVLHFQALYDDFKNVQVPTLCKIVIKINLEERKRPAVVTQTDTCLTIFIVKETDPTEGRLEWKCVDGQQPSEQMNDNTEVNCTDLFSCRSVSDSGIIQVQATARK